MLSTLDYIIYGIGSALLIFWLVSFFCGLKQASLFDAITEKEFPLKELYHVGYFILGLFHYSYHSKFDRKLRKELVIFYGEKYADYYLRVIHSQMISVTYLVVLLAFPMYGFSNSIAGLFIMLLLAGTAYYYFRTVTSKRILKRSEEMLSDFSNVVSKLALLTNAGMILREAWTEVAYSGQTTLYKEMQGAVEEMGNGVAEVDAIFRFGKRCIIPEIKKFSSTLVQGLIKGNSELAMMLQTQSREVWMLKKQDIRRQGEKAASKLMIPIVIMFIGILIMIIVPIFTNLGI